MSAVYVMNSRNHRTNKMNLIIGSFANQDGALFY
jgi:hypothetical protein